MAGETWPASLQQYPLREGYGVQMGDGRVITRMQQGAPRARRIYIGVPKKFTVSYIFDQTQWATFENFWETTLLGGVLTADLPVKTSAGNVTIEGLITKVSKTTLKGQSVKIMLEVTEA